MKKFVISIVSIIALGILAFIGYNVFQDDQTTKREGDVHQTNQANSQEHKQDPISLDKEAAKEMMNEYKQSFIGLYEESGEDGLITTYDSLDEVKNHFRQVMSEDLATWMIDGYIKEEGGELSFIAKDAPTWLANDKDFELKQLDKKLYNLEQERNNELLGHRIMTYQLKWQGDRWIVDEIKGEQLEQPEEAEEQKEDTTKKPSVKVVSKEVVSLLNDRDMGELAKYVHEQEDLLFSPYVNIQEDAVTFTKAEVKNLLEDQQTYTWGAYDGKGTPIELTPSEYFDEFVQVEQLTDPDETYKNQENQHGNTLNNIKEFFPESTVIEFYDNGTEENAGIDWSAIHLVWKQNEQDEWKLIAVVNDKWTI